MSVARESLNAAQRRAVEHAAGPLMVLSGPGTGKTRVITRRIAHMVEVRGVAPERIVALTYTVKAAEEMRQRLAALCQPGVAERVGVHTLHGFGLRILQRFGDTIGLRGNHDLIDSARKRRLVRELAAAHGLFPDLAAGRRDETLAWVDRQLDLLADHAVSPEAARVFGDSWAARLDRGEGVADAKEASAQRARLERFRHVARLRELCDAARLERGWLAYSDYLALPAAVMRRGGTPAAILLDEHRHYLVDEWQDTNAAQIELLTLLAPPADRPDLCVVGDDDQAIYGFRAADERAFSKFAERWSEHTVVRLEENYRCRSAIIDTANRVIAWCGDARFDAQKKIVRPQPDPAAGEPEPAGSVIGVALPKYTHDGPAIAAMILEQRALHPGLEWSDFAVLARSHKDLARVGAALELEGIPTRRVDKQGIIDDGVEDLLAWVRALVDPHDTIAVRRLLIRVPRCVRPDLVAGWERDYLAARSRAAEGEGTDPGGFVGYLAGHASAHPPVGELARLYATLAPLAATRRADEVIFKIVCDADLAHAELLSPAERAARMRAMVRVVRFARTRQARLEADGRGGEGGSLRAWLAYYNDLSENEQRFAEEQATDAEDGPEAPAEGDAEAERAVSLITMHSAKGLEFDSVFVTRLDPTSFPRVRVRDEELLPSGLTGPDDDDAGREARARNELRRLMYVACTRARRRLTLLGTWTKRGSGSEHFFEMLFRESHGAPAGPRIDAAEAIESAARRGVGPGARPAPTGLEGEAWDAASIRALADRVGATRRSARQAAAAALQRADDPGLTAEQADEVAATLRGAAERMTAAACVAAGAPVPAWLGEEGRALAARAGGGGKAGEAPGRAKLPGWRALAAPLALSYTFLNDYTRCPRCFFIKHVLKMPEAESGAINLGSAAHIALEGFFRRFRAADAEGLPAPGLDDLLALGRAAVLRLTDHDREIDRAALTSLGAMLRTVFERLHNPRDHIHEIERKIVFPYTSGEHTHAFSAKIDRLDSVPRADGSAGVRIIDYKTGVAWKKYLQPADDDLQLGVYALAVAHDRGVPEEALAGTAEYWVLGSGDRGVIDLAELNLAKVRSAIDKAVAGILAGAYPRGNDRNCRGDCAIFGSDLSGDGEGD